MTSGSILEIKDLALAYGGRNVLREVGFSIRAGEFWFFLGGNGQGKTTLLSALMGVLSPRQGAVVRTPGFSDREHIGYVPQRSDPNPTLPTTVREFVSLGFVGTGPSERSESDRLQAALQKVGLLGTERRNYWSLSGGERQRVLVARALVREPKLLLVDEPTNHLDPVAEHTLLESLGTLNRRDGLTIVFVTHDLSIVEEYATHIALFGQGRVDSGEARALLTPERLERTYGVPFVVRTDQDGTPIIRIKESGKTA